MASQDWKAGRFSCGIDFISIIQKSVTDTLRNHGQWIATFYKNGKKNQCDVISVTLQPTIITLGLELDDGC